MEETVTVYDDLKRLRGPSMVPADAGWPKRHDQLGIFVHRAVKAGFNMIMRQWERLLRNDGVKVWAVSPGLTATNLGGSAGAALLAVHGQDPMKAVELVIDVIEGKHDDSVGLIVKYGGGIQPW
jgi:NAD(P)-dependent dehydrogenase (short-subunit alcohol dehydrogenase family)